MAEPLTLDKDGLGSVRGTKKPTASGLSTEAAGSSEQRLILQREDSPEG